MKTRSFLLVSLTLLCWLLLPLRQSAAVEPITIGVTASLSGQYQVPGLAQLEGMLMWASDLNGRGALLGRKVELVYYDDQSDPEKSRQLYHQLITEDQVDLLLGPYSSSLTITASEAAEQHGFPMVAAGGASDRIWGRGLKNVFGVDAPASAYMRLPLEFAARMGLKRVGLVYAADEFPRLVAEGVRRKVAELGMQIVFEQEYPKDQTDFAETVRDLRAAKPELVLGGTYLHDSIELVRQSAAMKLLPSMMVLSVGPALPEFGQALGDAAEGVMGVVAWMPGARIPMARDFSFRYAQKYGHNAGVHAAYGYAAGQVLEAAVRLAGSLDKAVIRDRLRSLKFQSLLGHYRVNEAGMQEAKPTYVMQWQNGRRRLVLPLRVAETAVSYPLGSAVAH